MPSAPPGEVRNGDFREHRFEGACWVCGHRGHFARDRASSRESYACPGCSATLRYQAQAEVLVARFSRHGASSFAALAEEPEFGSMQIFEPGQMGPFRPLLRPLSGYVESVFLPGVPSGQVRSGSRCEDLMDLSFEPGTLGLVISSDILEHVRHPLSAFAELRRVLAPGGVHNFSIPVTAPLREHTRPRVDVSGEQDVFLLDPVYHGPRRHLVYNDFGQELLDELGQMGMPTQAYPFSSDERELARLLTFESVVPARRGGRMRPKIDRLLQRLGTGARNGRRCPRAKMAGSDGSRLQGGQLRSPLVRFATDMRSTPTLGPWGTDQVGPSAFT